ncbi:FitA-like ribbon-helix-helix domain-containing protein [Roseomonas genomospecies 6]|uniref:Plasmid stabilization protein n=1 Tax=Roseomonas genomospecies 6 TaxID=214106 RepID=A0A9W7TZP3_9PROT|nr:plasmid stabilization protein [Roseomonas genomospecies 6]KAA0683037.1 plasmid stabilization protein [Roseomonas genomospecies 6]
MGMITVRDIDDTVLKALTDRASAAGRSLEEEVRETLARSVRGSHEDFWERADRLRASFGGRVVSDSGVMSAEMREERSQRIGEP